MATESDVVRCEFGDCQSVAWRVLFWGPKKTPPQRAACWQHEGETDLSKFRDDLSLPPAKGCVHEPMASEETR